MPIYEYRRPDGSTFELVQSFSDDALTEDPETGAPVERVLHAPAVHFKGKGFYNTDYGTRKRQREDSAAKAESKSESESKGDSKKDESAKPAEKSDAKPAEKADAKAAPKPAAAAK
ncbi:MAG: FmdB family zinc ribbon protein [Solirubrobacteraceae bacterium]